MKKRIGEEEKWLQMLVISWFLPGQTWFDHLVEFRLFDRVWLFSDGAFRLGPSVLFCVITQQAAALQACDAHSCTAEKRNNHYFWHSNLPFNLQVYPQTASNLAFSLLYLCSFYSTKKKKVLQLCFFCQEYIFRRKPFQFLHIILSCLMQGGIWNTQVLLSHIVSLAFHSQR